MKITTDPKFNAWMERVDAAVQAASGCSIYDLADVCLYDWYEDGFTPMEAARAAINNEMGES